MFTIAIIVSLTLAQAPAPTPDQTTTSGFATTTYRAIKDFVTRSAEKMPSDQFTFQPTQEVRSFARLLAHIADANYLLCAFALGEPNPNGKQMDRIEKENLAREPLLERLKESFAYCDRAYTMLTEANSGEQVAFFGTQKRTRMGVLWFHISHAYEHYGNLVTYLRLKGIVPPSSEPRASATR
jgi:uncharacterized damage-inducible protein DinB